MSITELEIHKGLAGVVVDRTTISSVVPETNSLTYRGYPVQELAAECRFEEVAFLIWRGELPTPSELRHSPRVRDLSGEKWSSFSEVRGREDPALCLASTRRKSVVR